jgi:Icc protein
VVISGHVHQASDMTVRGVRYLTTPSTCIQFKPEQETFKVHDIAPGYRSLTLHPGGHLETAVVRVEGRVFPVDLNSGGYL